MKKAILILTLLFAAACSEEKVVIPDNRELIDANTALIELNSEMDALLEARVTALEERMGVVETSIETINQELATLGEETEENADAIAELRRKLRNAMRRQAFINYMNNRRLYRMQNSISGIQEDIERLVRKDKKLSKKLRRLARDLREVRMDLRRDTQMDLARFQRISWALGSLSRRVSELELNSVSIEESCEGLVLSTEEGQYGLVLNGEHQEVLYEQGDFVPERRVCNYRIWGHCLSWTTIPAHISEGETVSIFVAESVSLEEVEGLQCQGEER